MWEPDNGMVISVHEFVTGIYIAPPWVQDGNGADPDERSGSVTENLQIWKRRHDAERRNFQQN